MITQLISAVLLLLSGLTITGAGAFFSVKGFILFIPDPEIGHGLLVLAIGFEVAKITASTFLFHKSKDKSCPAALKIVLMSGVVSLIFLSAIFTFSHLNVSVSKSMAQVEIIDNAKNRRTEERDRLTKAIANVDKSIEAVPENASVAQRLRMKKAYDAEKAQLQTKLDKANEEIDKAEVNSTNEDRFLFLNSLSKLFGIDKATMFTVVVLFIVALIDPLAITLILAGTFVLAQYQADRQKDKQHVPDNERRPDVADGPADSGSNAGLLEPIQDAPEAQPVAVHVAPVDVEARQPEEELISLKDAVFEPENITPDTEPEEVAPEPEQPVTVTEPEPDHTKIEPEPVETPEVVAPVVVDVPEPSEPETTPEIVPDAEHQAIIDELGAEETSETAAAPRKRFIKVKHFDMGNKPNDAE
jgi:hypothetical protein